MPFRSPDHTVVRFSGPDATTFLQSQLTNDVAALAAGQWQWQGYCTAKGRVLATFALACVARDSFEAIVPTSTATALIKRLTMYRLRSKLTLEAAADRVAVFAFAGEPLPGGSSLPLSDGRCMVVADATISDTLTGTDATVGQRWALANIDARIPEVTAATSEMFVPQMIGWDTVEPGGGVSFSKGCYPGQEVVARAHYRGAVKRGLERVTLPAIQAAAGDAITLPDGRAADVCNAVATATGDTDALVVVALRDT